MFADEPVTIADRESERVMRDMIEQRHPAHAILGEEHGEKGDGKTSEWAWVLDRRRHEVVHHGQAAVWDTYCFC